MSRLKPLKLLTLRGFYQTEHLSSKTILVKEEKLSYAASIRKDEPRSGRICLRPPAACDFVVKVAVARLTHPRLARSASCASCFM
jgi:hypothetical protein